ncbi:hypothetical protein RDI58_002145 [Solanum bulbocastanum]|uniref:Uncharacterized protein n=1 Tax=Solanum bulbocastanum TaxID=147425 RepID=A0AAN8YQV5_SOLBU
MYILCLLEVEASSQLAARTVILHSRINWYFWLPTVILCWSWLHKSDLCCCFATCNNISIYIHTCCTHGYASQHYLHWLLKYLLRLLNQPLLQIYWDCVGFLDGSDAIT